MNKHPPIDIRDTVLNTAEQLIYQHGIHATGMDLLVRTSGVARKSIYRHFSTKDDIAAQALSARDIRWMAWFRTEVDKAQTPEGRILNLFTVLKSWFTSDGFRGCAFINIAGEVGDAADPVRLIAKEHKQKLLKYALELCKEYGAPDPDALAKQLLVLIDGAITVARVMGDPGSADSARDIAQHLLNT